MNERLGTLANYLFIHVKYFGNFGHMSVDLLAALHNNLI